MSDAYTVLVADDNEINRRLLVRILKSLGYVAVVAENGREAVDLALRARPQLILMDVRMPVMDGIEALKLLRQDETTKNIPVLAFSAHSDRQQMEALDHAGFDGFLSKPIDIDTLVETIRRLLGHSK